MVNKVGKQCLMIHHLIQCHHHHFYLFKCQFHKPRTSIISHYQSNVIPPIIVSIIITKDPRIVEQIASMNHLKQWMRQIRTFEGMISRNDFNGTLMTSLLRKFRMSDIERYTSIGCPHIHFRLYSTIMKAHELDET